MIGKIISSTPLYAWLLLALLLWKGLRARKLHRISWKDTLIFPAIMVVWSFYSTYKNYEAGTGSVAGGKSDLNLNSACFSKSIKMFLPY